MCKRYVCSAIKSLSQRNKGGVGFSFESTRRIEVKQTYLSIAAAVISIAGATTGFAAELPTYETTGLPISGVQVQVLGAANVQQQSQVPASAATPVQLSVLTPRAKLKTATVAPTRTTGLATH
jgi:hypothetical protein